MNEKECASCGEFVTDNVLLHCNHYICSICATNSKIQSMGVEDGQGSANGQGVALNSILNCPVCKIGSKVIQITENGVTVDNNTLQAFKMDDIVTKPQPGIVLCSLCEKLYASLECRECAAPFCVHCSGAFHSKTYFKSHHIVPIGTLAREHEQEKERMCKEHNKLLDIYCDDCKEICCVYCVQIGGHQGHNMITVETLEKEMKEEVNDFMRTMRDRQAQLQNGQDALERAKHRANQMIEETVARIQDQFDNLRNLLQARERVLYDEVHAVETEFAKKFDKAESFLNMWLNHVAKTKTNGSTHIGGAMSQSTDMMSDEVSSSSDNIFDKYLNILNESNIEPGRILSVRKALEDDKKTFANLLSAVDKKLSIYCSFDKSLESKIESYGYICSETGFIGTSLLTEEQGTYINKWIQEVREEQEPDPGRGGKKRKAVVAVNPATSAVLSWKLCYRASEDGASAQIFHQKCDALGETIVVARTTDGCLIGGYNPTSWTSSQCYIRTPKAFIFSLVHLDPATGSLVSEPHKIPVGRNAVHNAVYNAEANGPTFGGGHDIYIDHTMKSGYCNSHSYVSNEQTACFFMPGQRKQVQFEEIEVFCISENHPDTKKNMRRPTTSSSASSSSAASTQFSYGGDRTAANAMMADDTQTVEEKITLIAEMGFGGDEGLTRELLKKHNGNVSAVVSELLTFSSG